jgi:hypothetical protein
VIGYILSVDADLDLDEIWEFIGADDIDDTDLLFFQGLNKLPGSDDAGLLALLGKMARVSGHQVIGLGCLSTLQEAIVAFVGGTRHACRGYGHFACSSQAQGGGNLRPLNALKLGTAQNGSVFCNHGLGYTPNELPFNDQGKYGRGCAALR